MSISSALKPGSSIFSLYSVSLSEASCEQQGLMDQGLMDQLKVAGCMPLPQACMHMHT
jgi:hypothetical protein